MEEGDGGGGMEREASGEEGEVGMGGGGRVERDGSRERGIEERKE